MGIDNLYMDCETHWSKIHPLYAYFKRRSLGHISATERMLSQHRADVIRLALDSLLSPSTDSLLSTKQKAMSKPFDPTKPVQTRDGRKVRILDVNLKSNIGNIVAAIQRPGSDQENVRVLYADGHFSSSGSELPLDLVNVRAKQTVTVYVSLFKDGSFSVTRFKEHATQATLGAIAQRTFNLEITEGDTL